MFGFGNSETKKTAPPSPKPAQSRYARTSFKCNPKDELGGQVLEKSVLNTFGCTDIDYVLAHYAPITMRQLDHIESNVNAVYNTINQALENKNLEGQLIDLGERYGELYRKHDQLLKYLADERLKNKFTYKDETQEQR